MIINHNLTPIVPAKSVTPEALRILTASEEKSLAAIHAEMKSPSTSAEMRGRFARAALKLRGLDNLFAQTPNQ